MDNESTKSIITGAIAGALIGAGAALLFSTPQGDKIRTRVAELTDLVVENAPMLNERGHVLAEKGQEVVGMVKESLDGVKDLKDEAQSATKEVKGEIQGFKDSHNN
ncbi:YtxH domain-containing protein [Paenibacillus sp. PsM32]|uniref:YtxH domain-containing protein n=1 Tax=Paenibacillus kyungheensis TaxID=1452732 RepID=A0AAX3M0V5_9BACL|nr:MULTISPECIES: YtxH domain-containing protein [Paenibacillus]MDN4620242.1 YtxH domain-containing protein [Paenibacillus sp. PsM32]MDQ1236012.1 gas vesicle protein [Paenibacillus sp. SORGH_AS_0306]MDR6108369.1 gas vesicle protein [Paenibacillus sp. SORGH_AS_0338]WCT55492.1 YtxH domain-containing protein [Paenibacillus kyungheensis]WDF51350.1 YtxH domain-containing protein [Paenibacillus sp. KACC 21273]